ncbi:MAG: asparaginase [Myxococcota bacterium]
MTVSTLEPNVTAACVVRGNAVEAWHHASIAVFTPDGGVAHWFGDPELTTLARSGLKPFQAIALLTSGAADAFGFDERELALACASHNGSDLHVDVVRSMLVKAQVSAEALHCGAHLPIGMRIAGEQPTHGENLDPLRNNCSGKHAGFLALCRHLGEPLESYLDPLAATQQRVRDELAAACDVAAESLSGGVDGCSAPNYALPLAALARGMLRLALPEVAPERLRTALTRIRDAMLAHPQLVSGEKRFDYDLARAFPGNMLAKAGAEGIQLGALLEPPLGFAIKVHDGHDRALGAICISMLRQLGLLEEALPESLLPHERPVIKNHRKLVTGEIQATLTLSHARV